MENKNTPENKDKVAIVTGSATGIGYETAIHLAKNGFSTYASMRNLPKADEITKIAKSENLFLTHVVKKSNNVQASIGFKFIACKASIIT